MYHNLNNLYFEQEKKIVLAILILIVVMIIFLATKCILSGKNAAEYFIPELEIEKIQILDINSERAITTDYTIYDPSRLGYFNRHS